MDDTHFLECLLTILISSFQNSVQFYSPLLNQVICCLDVQLLELFIYSDTDLLSGV